jgi:hypothetical protein
MEYGRRPEEQLNTKVTLDSSLLEALRTYLRHEYEQTRDKPHRVLPIGQMRGTPAERYPNGPAITRFIIEQAVHSTRHRKRRPLEPDAAFRRLDERRVPAADNPEQPLNEAALAEIRDQFAAEHPPEPVWHIGKILVDELKRQRSPAAALVAEATLAAADELHDARGTPIIAQTAQNTLAPNAQQVA